jgi:predicted transcriptional regulator
MARTESGGRRLLREVMTTELTTLLPTDTVQRAPQQMKALNVGAIPICERNQFAGMMTDRDIVVPPPTDHRSRQSLGGHRLAGRSSREDQ